MVFCLLLAMKMLLIIKIITVIIIMTVIVFLLSKTQNYMFLLQIYQARGDEKLSKLVTKVFERSVNWNEYKTKSENKNTASEYRYFIESNFVGVNRLFVSVYSKKNTDSK